MNEKLFALFCLAVIMVAVAFCLFQLATISGYEGYIQGQFKNKVCFDKEKASSCLINRCQELKPYNISMSEYISLNTT